MSCGTEYCMETIFHCLLCRQKVDDCQCGACRYDECICGGHIQQWKDLRPLHLVLLILGWVSLLYNKLRYKDE